MVTKITAIKHVNLNGKTHYFVKMERGNRNFTVDVGRGTYAKIKALNEDGMEQVVERNEDIANTLVDEFQKSEDKKMKEFEKRLDKVYKGDITTIEEDENK